MHIYMMTRGIKQDVDRFITELSSKYLPYKLKGKQQWVQVAVRPIQLWEVVFPQEHRDIMLATLFEDGKGGLTQHKKHQKYVNLMRMGLGVKKIPTVYDTKNWLPLYRDNIEKIGIGMKEDYKIDGEERI